MYRKREKSIDEIKNKVYTKNREVSNEKKNL